MRGLRTLTLAAAVAALAISTLGAPASADGRGDVAIVNGIPGTKVDVCVNGKEISSALAYGTKTYRKIASGKKTIKIFRSDTRRCRGTLLGQRKFWLGPGGDKTIVASRSQGGMGLAPCGGRRCRQLQLRGSHPLRPSEERGGVGSRQGRVCDGPREA